MVEGGGGEAEYGKIFGPINSFFIDNRKFRKLNENKCITQ